MGKATAFGQRKEPHTVIIAQGQDIRHFTIRPWMAALSLAVFLAATMGYLLSTSYLILRDDLLSTAVARQAKLQHAYEDRIASLRGQVDRITSHRLLDQQFIETKIADLANRQSVLAQRSGLMAPVLDQAKSLGISPASASDMPVPQVRPGTQKSASLAPTITDPTITSSINPKSDEAGELPAIMMLTEVRNELSDLEFEQIRQVAALTDATYAKRTSLLESARNAGLPVKVDAITGTGGPFIPSDAANLGAQFQEEVISFNKAVGALNDAKGVVRSFPIVHPAPGKAISSRFGNRKDPILGRSAFHAGLDFRTPTGTPIRAAAEGKVVKAGRQGGYGKLVEIKHANGLSTRYAHLSKIYVKTGQKVPAGFKVGAAGSTGRSTGPHLHYEVRADGKPLNPLNYLKAGTDLRRYLSN